MRNSKLSQWKLNIAQVFITYMSYLTIIETFFAAWALDLLSSLFRRVFGSPKKEEEAA